VIVNVSKKGAGVSVPSGHDVAPVERGAERRACMAGERGRILLVDEDASCRRVLSSGLRREGFFVRAVADGQNALRLFTETAPDAVLLEARLPDMSGVDVCRVLRTISDVAIIMVSGVTEELDVVLSFELGADDYVAKPVRLRELIARVEAVTRRRDRARGGQAVKVREAVQIGDLRIHFLARVVEVDGAPIHMTRREFDLLAHLATVPGQLCSREELLGGVFGYDGATDGRTLDVHVYRLRSKIGKDPAHPSRIVTVRGLGYLLNVGELRARGTGARDVVDAATESVSRRGPLQSSDEVGSSARKRLPSSTTIFLARIPTQSPVRGSGTKGVRPRVRLLGRHGEALLPPRR
jgi:DNA-binding response OmpR family regulator